MIHRVQWLYDDETGEMWAEVPADDGTGDVGLGVDESPEDRRQRYDDSRTRAR